jgi:hypothetical protein
MVPEGKAVAVDRATRLVRARAARRQGVLHEVRPAWFSLESLGLLELGQQVQVEALKLHRVDRIGWFIIPP